MQHVSQIPRMLQSVFIIPDVTAESPISQNQNLCLIF